MKPFYQGRIDTFCAIYAVLNALRITHGIRTLKARELLNDTLMDLIKSPEQFKSVLDQTTDYINMVDNMLIKFAKKFPLAIEYPFIKSDNVTVEQFWDVCRSWMDIGPQRTAVFRFMRFFNINEAPTVKHWTAIGTIDDDTLSLYDSSHDAESIQHLHPQTIVTDIKKIDKDKTIFVQPNTLRLLRLPY
ncbi:MAG: hypothetical protein IJT59_06945 [Desulfovibrionaceae bacterium]|nr:hypothetical protein [Desulfovibrionaceae bacterium]